MLPFIRTASRPHLRAASVQILAIRSNTTGATSNVLRFGKSATKFHGYVVLILRFVIVLDFHSTCTDRDPAESFLSPTNQKLLKSMTRLRLDKVYRKRVVLNNRVEYKFMTTEQIEDEVRSAITKAEALLQMPPVMQV